MMKRLLHLLSTAILCFSFCSVSAQPTVKFDATKTHQRVTGFGGFVCSPQFTYNHMSTTEIKKVWGSTSTVGCNIMRLYIPIGRNAWSQSLQTAKTAKQMGLIVFASPWGQPAEWKTNGTSNAKNPDGTLGYLKRENWPDYAEYLNDYVEYLRQNGVELDAISIQNEPDWPATYAGCLWSAAEIAEFVKTYGPTISCKVMAPETLSVNDNYVNALNKSDVLPGFDIYGGHQYGGIQSAYKQLAAKGKEIWMTEYLINWNENENTTRNFNFQKDFFDFFRAINTCMLGDFNAWVHYAAKRYYAMLGDGQNGTSNGNVTKRGYVMAHFARFVTGMTRIDINFGTTGLEGSAYLSESGDTVVAVIANASDESVAMTLDLPFYTQDGKQYNTTKSNSMLATTLTPETETCRPVASVPAQSVSTVLFVKSRDRQPSNMAGSTTRFDRIDDMKTTNSAFGSGYKLSGKTKTFDHSNPLISSRTTAASGYVALDDRYSRLVMEVKKVTSTLNYSSAKTTLTYVNAAGQVASHDYGDLNLDRRENFNLIFDLSPATLPDGCIGVISLTNNNWSSTLTMTFGDVTFDHGSGSPYAAKLSGDYVEDDSFVQEFTNDQNCTSLDMSQVGNLPASLPWLEGSNRIVFLPAGSNIDACNVVNDGRCQRLVLATGCGDFRPSTTFEADDATLTTNIEECRLLILPFHATIPAGFRAFVFDNNLELIEMRSIPANAPVLVTGSGTAVFHGSGEVAFVKSPVGNTLRGTYTFVPLYVGDYVLGQQNNQWGFRRISDTMRLSPLDVYASLDSQEPFIVLPIETEGITAVSNTPHDAVTYDLQGRIMPGTSLAPGIYIRNGKKIVVR